MRGRESWNVPIDSSCDAAALAALELKIERQEIEEEEIVHQMMVANMNGSLDRYLESWMKYKL